MSQNPMQLADATSRPSETSPERLALILEWLTVYELAFPGFGESRGESAALVYSSLLADLSGAELEHGLEQAALRCKRYPTVAHIREFAGEVLPSEPADSRVTIEQIRELWAMLCRAYPNDRNIAKAEARFFRVLCSAEDARAVGNAMLRNAKALAKVPRSRQRFEVPSLFDFVDSRWREDWAEATRPLMAWE